MDEHDETSQLLERWRAGDEAAAAAIFDQYVRRLVRLAGDRLTGRLRRRVDPEDVVQSAFRSFFRVAGEGRYHVEGTGDLWRLLATITVNKVRGRAGHERADKRDVAREHEPRTTPGIDPEAVAREPDAAEVAGVVEELESVMAELDPLERRILELRLQEAETDEIAEAVDRSRRTVQRTLATIRARLEARLDV